MPRRSPSVAVIGAGFGGIAAGVKLRRAGIDDVTVFERSAGAGGTWYDAGYPGAEVDTGSHVYSFSFKKHEWSRTHARRAELLAYLEEAIDENGLRPHLRLGTAVHEVSWDEPGQSHRVRLESGEERRFDVVVTAVGLLNEPRYPDWPGLAGFEGPCFHTARWPREIDLEGKTVAVVGTGSSAAQVVPALAPLAGKLYVFQREPGWVTPKRDRDYTAEERARLRRPLAQTIERLKLILFYDAFTKAQFPGTKQSERFKADSLRFIDSVFGDREDLRQAVTPHYPFAGKRVVKSDAFYPALRLPNVELVPRAVTRVTADGVVDASGVERKVDALVLATGYRPTRFLSSLSVRGRGGTSLHDAWAGEPEAFLGLMVPGFPNFFMLYGPNTNGGPGIAFMLERQAEYVAAAVRYLAASGRASVEVRPSFMRRYNAWLQRGIHGSAWELANNYFKTESGRVVTQFPYSGSLYWLLTRGLRRIAWRSEPATARARDEVVGELPTVARPNP
jgi:cation diffusion facilitator CzcD-associated flavoprotein CzcO